MYVPLGLYIRLMDLVCPLGAHLCLFGALLCSQGSSTRAPPYVCVLWDLLSPLRLIYVPWGLIHAPWAQLCPLELNYALWGSFMPHGGQVRAPSYVCAP
jgi:hypothetical protein